MSLPRVLAALAVLFAAAAAPPAAAQQIDTLDQALAMVAWDPQNLRPRAPDEASPPAPPPLPPPRPDGYALRTVAQRFERKIFTLDTVTVLAPPEMALLNTNLGKPDPLAGMSRSDKMRLLMTSLGPEQWRQLGSAQELGLADLTREQQPVFLSLLPEPFRIRKAVATEGGSYDYQEDDPITLTPPEKARVRLRLNRKVSLYAPRLSKPDSFWTFPLGPKQPEGAEFFVLEDAPDREQRSDLFGVTLRAYPSRPDCL